MPDEKSSPLKAVIGWAGGIAAAVITAVLIARLSPAPTPAPPDSVTNRAVTLDINGYVLDSATHATVHNANVILTLGKFSGHQRTDATGKYRIILNEPVAEAVMTDIRVTAPGYQPFQNTLAVSPPGGYNEILVDAEPPPPLPVHPGLPPGPPPATEPAHRAVILIKPFPAGFIKGAAAAMSRTPAPKE